MQAFKTPIHDSPSIRSTFEIYTVFPVIIFCIAQHKYIEHVVIDSKSQFYYNPRQFRDLKDLLQKLFEI